jgi:hypothetical protein
LICFARHGELLRRIRAKNKDPTDSRWASLASAALHEDRGLPPLCLSVALEFSSLSRRRNTAGPRAIIFRDGFPLSSGVSGFLRAVFLGGTGLNGETNQKSQGFPNHGWLRFPAIPHAMNPLGVVVEGDIAIAGVPARPKTALRGYEEERMSQLVRWCPNLWRGGQFKITDGLGSRLAGKSPSMIRPGSPTRRPILRWLFTCLRHSFPQCGTVC